MTLSIVGYGSLVPQTLSGKIDTTVFFFVGLGIFAVAIQRIGSYALDMRHRNAEWLVARLDHHGRHARRDGKDRAADEPDPANLSSAPPADSPARGPDAPPPGKPSEPD